MDEKIMVNSKFVMLGNRKSIGCRLQHFNQSKIMEI